MLKKISFTLILIALSLNCNAFSIYYYHGVGLKYNYANVKTYPKQLNFSNLSFTYKATFASTNTMKNHHFACSFYPSLGAKLPNKKDEGSKSYCAEIPVMLEWYYGVIDQDCKYFGIGITNSFFSKTSQSITNQTLIIGPQIEYGKQFKKDSYHVGYRINLAYGLNSPEKTDPVSNHTYRENKFLLGFNLYLVLNSRNK
jgi:hypothetical protein